MFVACSAAATALERRSVIAGQENAGELARLNALPHGTEPRLEVTATTGCHAHSHHVLAAVVNTTVVAGENLTVGSTVWLPAESVAPGR